MGIALNYLIHLKRLLLIFWAIWLSIVFLSNLADGAKGLGWLGESWPFASGNWKLLQQTTALYKISAVMNAVLFVGVLLWEGAAAVLFWRAAWSFRGRDSAHQSVYLAFMVSLLLWSAFLIADEIFIAYSLESVHMRLLLVHLTTLLVVDLIPER